MKIRPYRVCDICGEEYHKTHNCMKVKILIDPMRYTEMYGDLPIMSKWDICPKCAEDLMSELMLKVADRKTEPQKCDDCVWSVCNYNKVDWERAEQTDCGDFANRLAYERGVKHAWEVAQKVFDSTVTFYEAEDVAKQIDKDMNVRSKTEPQTERRD